jgi:hypothetical protein
MPLSSLFDGFAVEHCIEWVGLDPVDTGRAALGSPRAL